MLDGPCGGGTRAERVYDTFWATLDAEYAVFAERLPDGDWEALGREGCDGLGEDRDALFAALLGLAENLDDGHIQLRGGGHDEDAWVSAYPHEDLLDEVPDRYAEHSGANGRMAWGRLDDVGYLAITGMDGLSLTGGEAPDVRRAHAVLDEVFADLDGVSGLVVDVRANDGGWDPVSLGIASRFEGPRTLAWSERERAGPAHDDFGPWTDVFVEASSDAFAGPVVLLTSGGTFSAGESFVLAMRERPGVTVLGERTSGHLSDLFDLRLPNGWHATYSGEQLRAADGEIYEARGVPPDVEVPLDAAALEAGTDRMLDAALALLSGS